MTPHLKPKLDTKQLQINHQMRQLFIDVPEFLEPGYRFGIRTEEKITSPYVAVHVRPEIVKLFLSWSQVPGVTPQPKKELQLGGYCDVASSTVTEEKEGGFFVVSKGQTSEIRFLAVTRGILDRSKFNIG